jgi:hypothetical protein
MPLGAIARPDMKIITVPGIESRGVKSTDRIGRAMKELGYDTHDIDQPVRSAWGARWKAEKDAKDIIHYSNDGDVIIAHSYGCLKASIAMRGVNFLAAFLFRPAMSRWQKFPQYQKTKTFCIYSKQDYTILGGSLLLFHPFGLAGFKGFRSPFVTNMKSHGAHSDDFKDDSLFNLDYWSTWIDKEIKFLQREGHNESAI